MILPIPIIEEKQIIIWGILYGHSSQFHNLVLDEKFQRNKLYLLLGQNLSMERNFLNYAHGLLRTKSKKKTIKVQSQFKLVLKFLEC